jgi:hypothetical protein
MPTSADRLRSAARAATIGRMRIRSLLAGLGLLLAAPASALAATAEESAGGTDHTTEIMFGLILVLMVGLVVLGIVEQRKPH